jgi:hypothetical protein
LTEVELAHLRYNSFLQAIEINPLRFNVEKKASTEELITEAKKIYNFILGDAGTLF